MFIKKELLCLLHIFLNKKLTYFVRSLLAYKSIFFTQSQLAKEIKQKALTLASVVKNDKVIWIKVLPNQASRLGMVF